jgi:hypothetical protein
MADELGWDQTRVEEEVDDTIRQFPNLLYKFRNGASK